MLSDVMMPGGMDGLCFAKELGSRGIDLPVVLGSGHRDAIRRDSEQAGIPLLAEPYRLDELSAVLAARN